MAAEQPAYFRTNQMYSHSTPAEQPAKFQNNKKTLELPVKFYKNKIYSHRTVVEQPTKLDTSEVILTAQLRSSLTSYRKSHIFPQKKSNLPEEPDVKF